MSFFDDEVRPEGSSACERCGRDCEAIEVEVCPICKKRFCLHCVHRVGSNRYCSRACGETFYYGGLEEEEEE